MISITRKIEQNLVDWAKSSGRKVLLLRGARQVGKTYLIRNHAKRYKHLLEINLMSDKKAHTFFKGDLDIEKIIEQLSTYYNTPIIDGETLLFFDEVQECTETLTALRFFYEKRPNLHVIATGSLLEFALSEIPSFGVGRVQSIFLYPVSFDEYLGAAGEEKLLKYLEKAGPSTNASNVIHDKLCNYFKTYLFHGGLPEVVSNFLGNRNFHATANLLDSLRIAFEDDFIKYQKKVPTARLREVLRSVSLQAGKKFVHSHAYADANAAQVHHALELLNQAGIIYKVYHSSCNGVPLGAEVNLKKFKALPFDHGIYQRVIGVTPAEVVEANFDLINKGALAEVYAGCALLAQASPIVKEDLHYWHRESKSSNAEVDYVLQVGSRVVPLEIKAATKGRMQSMYKFLEEKRAKIGIRATLENFAAYDNILVIPLYAFSQIERLVGEISR